MHLGKIRFSPTWKILFNDPQKWVIMPSTRWRWKSIKTLNWCLQMFPCCAWMQLQHAHFDVGLWMVYYDGFFVLTWPMLNHCHRMVVPHLHQEAIVLPTRPQPQTIVGVCCSWTQSSCVDFDTNIEWGHFQLTHKCTNPLDDQLIFSSLILIGPSILHDNFQLQHWCLAQHMVDFEIQPLTCESYVANFPTCISKRH